MEPKINNTIYNYKDMREFYWRPEARRILNDIDTNSSRGVEIISIIDKAIQMPESYQNSNFPMEVLLEAVRSKHKVFMYPKYISAVNVYAPTLKGFRRATKREIIRTIMDTVEVIEDYMLSRKSFKLVYTEDTLKKYTIPQTLYGLDTLIANKNIGHQSLQELLIYISKILVKPIDAITVDTNDISKTIDEIANTLDISICIIDSSYNVDRDNFTLYNTKNIQNIASNKPVSEIYNILETLTITSKGSKPYIIYNEDENNKTFIVLKYGDRYILLGRMEKEMWNTTFDSYKFITTPIKSTKKPSQYSIHEIMKHWNYHTKVVEEKEYINVLTKFMENQDNQQNPTDRIKEILGWGDMSILDKAIYRLKMDDLVEAISRDELKKDIIQLETMNILSTF